MPAAMGERAIDFALSRFPSSLRVGFFGGEPLLERPLMRHLAAYARARAGRRTPVSFQLTTSGHSLDEDVATFLGTNAFEVSLSVHDEDWVTTRGRLRMLTAAGVAPRAVLVADPKGASALADRVQALASVGANDIAVSPDYYARWDRGARQGLRRSYERMAWLHRKGGVLGGVRIRLFDSRLEALRRGVALGDSRCGLGRRQLVVGPDGGLFPCERLAVDRTGGTMQVGHLESGLDEEKLDGIERERRQVPAACSACPNRVICAGFCACVNVHLTGSVCAAPEVVCWHESMLGDVVRGLLEETKCDDDHITRRPGRQRAPVAASVAVAALLAGSCGGEKVVSSGAVPREGPAVEQGPRADAVWVIYPEKAGLGVVDRSGTIAEVQLRLLTVLEADRMREVLVADGERIATLVREHLVGIELESLIQEATQEAVAEDLLRSIREMTALDAELLDLRLQVGPWQLSREEIEALKAMGYIG